MTDDAEKIIGQARATLDRVRNIRSPAEPTLPPPDDALTKWKRDAEQREAAAAAETERRRQREREGDLAAIEQRVEQRIRATLDQTLATERHYWMTELLPELVAALQQRIADDVSVEIERAYKLALADVRADLNALRQAVAKVAGTDDKVLHMPPLRSARPLN
jgi:hypothetical protein